MNQRQINILDLVNSRNRVSVQEAAEALQVSVVTIRKDFQFLEKTGLLTRMHGYATRASTDDISCRLACNYATKQRIAKKAAEMVSPGETIMIESGSTCALLALELVKQEKNVTIITNSTFIARYVRHLDAARIIILGGDYQNKSEVMVGPMTMMGAREYHVDKIFIGTDGYHDDFGFSIASHTRGQTVIAMCKSAEKIFILTDSSKFGSRSVSHLFHANEINTLITDLDLPESSCKALVQNGVNVLTV
jgi:DeoR/GlpR family transcriptional regulator of sugar metabolism